MEPFKDIDDFTLTELVSKQDEVYELLSNLPSRDASVDEVRTGIRNFAIANLEGALATVVRLSQSAEKETTELAASKVIISLAKDVVDKDDQDLVKALFDSLKN